MPTDQRTATRYARQPNKFTLFVADSKNGGDALPIQGKAKGYKTNEKHKKSIKNIKKWLHYI